MLYEERVQPEASGRIQSRERKSYTEHGQQTGHGHVGRRRGAREEDKKRGAGVENRREHS